MPTGHSYRGSPAVFWFDDVELPVDDTLNSGGFAAKRSELAESLHPRSVARNRCDRAARELLLQGLGHEGSEGLSALSRLGLGPAKHRIWNLEGGLHVTSPYSHIYGHGGNQTTARDAISEARDQCGRDRQIRRGQRRRPTPRLDW